MKLRPTPTWLLATIAVRREQQRRSQFQPRLSHKHRTVVPRSASTTTQVRCGSTASPSMPRTTRPRWRPRKLSTALSNGTHPWASPRLSPSGGTRTSIKFKTPHLGDCLARTSTSAPTHFRCWATVLFKPPVLALVSKQLRTLVPKVLSATSKNSPTTSHTSGGSLVPKALVTTASGS